MKIETDKIFVFEEFFRLKSSVKCTLVLFVCLLLLCNTSIMASMCFAWQLFIPFGGMVSCLFFIYTLNLFVKRLVKEQDDILFVELICSFLLLLLASSPIILYIFLNGHWDAVTSWDYFSLYFTARNLILPLMVLAFTIYLYWMLIVHLCNGSEIYYNCIKHKQDNER